MTVNQSIQGIIYCCFNKRNGKVYIGQTIQKLGARINHIKRAKKGEGFRFHAAIRKHGIESFTTVLTHTTNTFDLNEAEMHWISHFRSCDYAFGYNISMGGKGRTGDETKDRHKSKGLKRIQARCLKSVVFGTFATHRQLASVDAILRV